jgi:hypothetical protein
LQGVVSYPPGVSGNPAPTGILRVWLASNDSGGACPAIPSWPPAYRVDIDPAPNPASYRFDEVPTGAYCLTVVLDTMPYFADGETPGCMDPRSASTSVMVTAPVTTAPAVTLALPSSCP